MTRYDPGEALNSWQQRCADIERRLRNIINPEFFDVFTCGQALDISAGVDFYTMASNPEVNVRYRSIREARRTDGATITGVLRQHDQVAALRDWEDKCLDDLKTSKQNYGARFLAASCGLPNNLSTGSFYQYSSRVMIWLMD